MEKLRDGGMSLSNGKDHVIYQHIKALTSLLHATIEALLS